MLLHNSSTPQSSSTPQRLPGGDHESLRSARSSVRKILEDSLLKLQEESSKCSKSIRWELGACWIQHLQNQASGKAEAKKTEETKPEPAVKGLGKQGALLREIKKKIDVSKNEEGKDVTSVTNLAPSKNYDSTIQKESEKKDEKMEVIWKKLLPEAAYLRLKESETGLHLKVCLLLSKSLDLSTFACLHLMLQISHWLSIINSSGNRLFYIVEKGTRCSKFIICHLQIHI